MTEQQILEHVRQQVTDRVSHLLSLHGKDRQFALSTWMDPQAEVFFADFTDRRTDNRATVGVWTENLPFEIQVYVNGPEDCLPPIIATDSVDEAAACMLGIIMALDLTFASR